MDEEEVTSGPGSLDSTTSSTRTGRRRRKKKQAKKSGGLRREDQEGRRKKKTELSSDRGEQRQVRGHLELRDQCLVLP